MQKFSYTGKANILHLNVRKEGPDDDKILAVDLKLECIAPAHLIDFFDEGLREVLYTDVGAVKNKRMEAIGFNNTVENGELMVFDDSRFLGVTFGKFKIKAKDTHQVTLTFSASFQPSKDEVAILAEHVSDEIDIDARTSPQLDFGMSQAVVGSDFRPGAGEPTGDYDGLYDQAVAVVRAQKRASISLVQRHLRIGYNRAARLLEQMEAEGVVSAMRSDGSRQILRAA